jgi:hypothetical protein
LAYQNVPGVFSKTWAKWNFGEKKMHTSRVIVFAALVNCCCTAVNGAVVPILGGTTSVTFNETFLGVGLNASTIGSASLGGATATFPINGGTVDTDTSVALIERDGSGLTLNDTISFLDLENFLIDKSVPGISGDVTLNAGFVGNVPLFQLGPSLEVLLTVTAADVLDATFLGIGVAVTNPVVPEPSTALLLSMSLVALTLSRRRVR